MLTMKNKTLDKPINECIKTYRLPLVLTSSIFLISVAQAEEKTTPHNDVILVTANGTESVTAPLKGFVAKESASGTKVATPLVKTPQAISVITRDQMDAQHVDSVADALNYNSGTVTSYRGSSNRNDEVIVRGFRYAAKYLDGLSFGLSGQDGGLGKIDPWFLERVEVVRGPASVLYGQVNPGGLISMTSKRPTAETIRKVQLSTGNQHLGEAAFDFGSALNDDQSLLYRLNGIGSTKHEFIKNSKQERIAIAPSLTWLPNTDTSFTLMTLYQNDPEAGFRNFLPAYGTAIGTTSGYIPYHMNISDPNYHRSKRELASIGYIFEHAFNDVVSFQQNVRYSQLKEKYKYLVYTIGGSATSSHINLRQQKEEAKTDEMGIDNQLKAQFNIGNVDHTLIGGLDYKAQKRNTTMQVNRRDQYDYDWANPSHNVGYLLPDSQLTLITDDLKKIDQVGIYLQDQIEWNNWNLLLSGRHDWSEIRSTDRTSSSFKQQNNNKFTGRAGLLYAFDNGISPYISYSTSFEPNVDSGAPGTDPFKPTTGEQKEVGVKFQPKGSDTMLTLSLFDITQKNLSSSRYFPEYDRNYSEQIGKVKSKGVETELRSQLTPEFSLLAAYTYLDTLTKESHTAGEVNKAMPAIPRHSASAWGEYQFMNGVLQGLKLGTGVRYMGTTYGDRKEGYKVPHYTLYDAMASYDLGTASPSLKGAEVKLNLNNLTDKHYVASCSNTEACFYGSGRSIIATVSYSW
ncbi:TonB-dependent siderophore receptor [Pectobacterium araliae]|uniref:TonB-dependent siderophore receptor n=1 Tax=Pectobacterium araliae TaxID=3073862 RepID=A0AAN0KBM5_9GAMM|nr:TonB-dependent siderophore receptor [Pectobacterium sp. MAFF 302110]